MDKALSSATTKPTEGPFGIFYLSGLELDRHWDTLCKELTAVRHLWEDRWTLDYLYFAAQDGRVQFWGLGHEPKIEFVVMTQVAVYPAARTLQIVLALGEGVLKEVKELLDITLDRFGALHGCTEIEVIGREGWKRELAAYGFKQKFVVLSRPIKNMTVN